MPFAPPATQPAPLFAAAPLVRSAGITPPPPLIDVVPTSAAVGVTEVGTASAGIAHAPAAGSDDSGSDNAGSDNADSDDDEFYERTQLSSRRRESWELVTKEGEVYTLAGADVTVGRAAARPSGPGHVGIADVTKTMSKAHARFTMVNGAWFVEDLSSTNGTSLVDAAGREVEVLPGTAVQVTGSLLLGDVEVTLRLAADAR